jgi:alanine racemase
MARPPNLKGTGPAAFAAQFAGGRDGEGDISESRCVADLSARALNQNYEAIRAQVAGRAMLPMIKANAYGHGALWAARELCDGADLFGLGVATLEEGRELRDGGGARLKRTRIIVFSGTANWNDDKGQYCERHALTPVIAAEPDWKAFVQGGWHKRVPYHIKFNTGMNRLGLPMSLAAAIARQVQGFEATSHPDGIASHLAQAENPDTKLSLRQLEAFVALRAEFSRAAPSAHFHLGNSSAIWNAKHWQLEDLTDIVRPGLSLYGVPPWKGAPARGLQPVLTLSAEVLKVDRLKAGESVGYGGTYTTTEPEFIATLGAGYADGLPRAWSGRGHAWLGNRPTRFRGIVSMDLSAVNADPQTRVGDWAELLGPRVDIWAQAQEAGTIPYELLTSVSSRVKRRYG